MTEPRWLNESEAQMWRSLRLMWMRLEQVLEQQLSAESGLSAADFALLVPLSEAPAEGLRHGVLARGVNWDRSRLSHQLRRMTERGLVQKSNCPTDARGGMFTLTEAGRRAIENAAPSHVELVRRVFVDTLSREELATLTTVARKVLDAVDTEVTERALRGECREELVEDICPSLDVSGAAAAGESVGVPQ